MVIQIQIPNIIFPSTKVRDPRVQVEWTKEQIMEAFKRHDSNGDGKLSKAELKQAFKYLGSNWGGRRASKAMSYADNDGSGFIDITDKELEELVE